MLYQVRANMFFDKEDEANDFIHDCILVLAKAIVVKPHQPSQECSQWELLHCNHDLNPNEPCTRVDHDDNCPEPEEPAEPD